MIPEQIIHPINPAELKHRAEAYHRDGWRLVQICATTLDHYELSYSFTRKNEFEHIRLALPLEQPAIDSITDVYFGAFAYENELHDLFGIKFNGLKLDYCGNFFKMSAHRPFAAATCELQGGKPNG